MVFTPTGTGVVVVVHAGTGVAAGAGAGAGHIVAAAGGAIIINVAAASTTSTTTTTTTTTTITAAAATAATHPGLINIAPSIRAQLQAEQAGFDGRKQKRQACAVALSANTHGDPDSRSPIADCVHAFWVVEQIDLQVPDQRQVAQLEGRLKSTRPLFFVVVLGIFVRASAGPRRRDRGDVKGVSAEEDGARFVVDLLIGSEDGGVQIVAGVLTRNGALERRRRDKEVRVNVKTELWREDVEEWRARRCSRSHFRRMAWPWP